MAHRAALQPDRARIAAYRERLQRACAVDTRPARFLRHYLATCLDRVAWNCAALEPLVHERSWLDLGGFGIEPLLLRAAGVACEGHVASFEGDRVGLDTDGGLTDEVPAMRHEVVVQQLDLERTALPFADRSLRLVSCFEVLEHLKFDPRAMLGEIRRVLAPDGVLWLTTPNILSVRSTVRGLFGKNPHENPRYHGDPGHGVIHPKEYTAYELRELAAGCGFEVLELRAQTFRRQGLGERTVSVALRLLRHAGHRVLRWPHASRDTGDNLVLLARAGGGVRAMPLLFEA